MKRLLDLVASAVGLLLLWPVFLVAAVLIKLEDGGPVFFRQLRVGRGCRSFMILKFRTMRVDAPSKGPAITVKNDTRITAIGSILRHTKLDELPQLWNVLRGEMSLVGARPEVPRYVDLFRSEYTEILKLRPGITDLASIRYRDESALLAQAEDPEAAYVQRILPEKLKLSRDYVRNASWTYDLQLLFTTLACLVYPVRAIERVVDVLSPYRFWIGILVQTAAVAAAYLLAFEIRFDGRVPAIEQPAMWNALPVVLLARVLWLNAFQLFHGVWRYSGVRDLRSIAFAVTFGSLTWWAAAHWLVGAQGFSRGVVAIDWLLCITFLAGIRVVRRLHRELRPDSMPTRRVLLVGDEDSMARVARDLRDRPAQDCQVIGMLNGDLRRKGARIHGIPVLGTKADLADIIRQTDPDEVLLAMPGASLEMRESLLQQCRSLGKSARYAPDVTDLLLRPESPRLGGDYSPEDLLFRESIKTDAAFARGVVAGRCVLITGAGGSIGSEISRQVASHAPARLVLFERHEFALYEIERELRRLHPGLALEPVIGDVADARRVDGAFGEFKPDVVFHAAAYKHVPMMERNPGEALRTNVVGTRTAAEAAVRHGTDVFVLISTDKAVEPVCMMGISKRMAELSLQLMKPGCATKLLTVRFGNVLESSGSVLPLFREQIERGGPVTVTHPEVTRLFMTVPEAVQLILHAASIGHGGEVFVLDMGKPVRILDMAKALIRLYGLEPGKDIAIDITGLRPGERLFEKLLNDNEVVWKSAHPKILRAVNQADGTFTREEMVRLLRESERRLAGRPDLIRRIEETLPA
jgi:FlaA1/EpsC-like NDP-sugar epimerase/lipopolysaccharide/colanic/teichoic acid biosynthesis glycosyltransferase